MRIRVFGVFTETGIGTHARNVLHFLHKIQSVLVQVEHFSISDPNQVQQAIETTVETDVSIHLFPDGFATQLKGKRIYWAVFESTRPPPGFLGWFNMFDHVISASDWGRTCMINYGASSEKIVVIPEGVDPWIYHPYANRPRQPVTRFTIVGKFESRKGYEVALQAFEIAHKTNPNMELWVKPDWINGQQAQVHPDFVRLAQNYPHLPIVLVSGILSIEQMQSLYRDTSYFLFPSLCEGWGLPLIEAIASGVPAICCEHGGQSEFLKPIQGKYTPIPYTLQPITCQTWKNWYHHTDGDYGQWAAIDPNTLAAILIQACGTDGRQQAREAALLIRKEFSWERSVDKLLSFIFRVSPQ
jgi:glycosyltransferase involved in cell wall biosynthesis